MQQLRIQLTDAQLGEVLAYLDREQRRRAVERVRAAVTVSDKLLAALGEDAIACQLPKKVIDSALEASPDLPVGDVLARAALAVFGVEILKTYTSELVEAGFDPPRQWHGGRRVADFCEELGFSPEYAGFATGRRDPMLEVDGPVELKPLHDFQEVIAERIQTFFRSKQTRSRALIIADRRRKDARCRRSADTRDQERTSVKSHPVDRAD